MTIGLSTAAGWLFWILPAQPRFSETCVGRAGAEDNGVEFVITVPNMLTTGEDAELAGTTVGVFATANAANTAICSTPATFERWVL